MAICVKKFIKKICTFCYFLKRKTIYIKAVESQATNDRQIINHKKNKK